MGRRDGLGGMGRGLAVGLGLLVGLAHATPAAVEPGRVPHAAPAATITPVAQPAPGGAVPACLQPPHPGGRGVYAAPPVHGRRRRPRPRALMPGPSAGPAAAPRSVAGPTWEARLAALSSSRGLTRWWRAGPAGFRDPPAAALLPAARALRAPASLPHSVQSPPHHLFVRARRPRRTPVPLVPRRERGRFRDLVSTTCCPFRTARSVRAPHRPGDDPEE